MKNPHLPVADKWVTPIEVKSEAAVRTPFVIHPIETTSLDPNIIVLGSFGKFLTIKFDGRLYLMPSILIQWLLWSFDHKLDKQFSNQERQFLVGASSQAEIERILTAEQHQLCNWLQRQEKVIGQDSVMQQAATTGVPPSVEAAVDAFLDECPGPIFFDEGV